MGSCISCHLNCDTGNLGNGKALLQVGDFSWPAIPRLVAIPPHLTTSVPPDGLSLQTSFRATKVSVILEHGMPGGLGAHHARILNCVRVHRALCVSTKPEAGRLTLSRLRLLAASADHSRFLARNVLPALQSRAEPPVDKLIADLCADLAERKASFEAHVDRWDAIAIERQWDAYRSAAAIILLAIEQRVLFEDKVLTPLLT